MKTYAHTARLYRICYHVFVYCGVLALVSCLPWWSDYPVAQWIARLSLGAAFSVLFSAPLIALLTIGIDQKERGWKTCWHLPILAALIAAMIIPLMRF